MHHMVFLVDVYIVTGRITYVQQAVYPDPVL